MEVFGLSTGPIVPFFTITLLQLSISNAQEVEAVVDVIEYPLRSRVTLSACITSPVDLSPHKRYTPDSVIVFGSVNTEPVRQSIFESMLSTVETNSSITVQVQYSLQN